MKMVPFKCSLWCMDWSKRVERILSKVGLWEDSWCLGGDFNSI